MSNVCGTILMWRAMSCWWPAVVQLVVKSYIMTTSLDLTSSKGGWVKYVMLAIFLALPPKFNNLYYLLVQMIDSIQFSEEILMREIDRCWRLLVK
jgi:hypothetical protein